MSEAKKKAPAKKSSKKPAAKEATTGKGRTSAFAGKKLTKLVAENPRREGTHGHDSFNVIKNGISYEQYIAAGGRLIDLKYDVDHKYVKVA